MQKKKNKIIEKLKFLKNKLLIFNPMNIEKIDTEQKVPVLNTENNNHEEKLVPILFPRLIKPRKEESIEQTISTIEINYIIYNLAGEFSVNKWHIVLNELYEMLLKHELESFYDNYIESHLIRTMLDNRKLDINHFINTLPLPFDLMLYIDYDVLITTKKEIITKLNNSLISDYIKTKK